MGKCIGIDIGYGFTKSYMPGQAKIFPTAVTASVPRKTFGEARYISANGEAFLVGEDAEREGLGLIETRTSGFLTSNAWLAILGFALAEAGFIPGHSVLVLGVPPVLYPKALCEEIADCVKSSRIVVEGSYLFDFFQTSVRVIPQGSGIFFSYLNEHPEAITKKVAILDMGHHTADLLFFSGGKYVEGAVETLAVGTSVVLDGILKTFYRKYGFSIHYPEAKELLISGKITILERDYELPEVKEITEPYARQIASIVDRYFERLPASPDIGIAGGGGIMLLNGLVKLRRKLNVVAFPEMANAFGSWLYGSKIL